MNNISLFFQIFNLNGQFWILDQLMIFASAYLMYLTLLLIFILALKGGVREKKTFILVLIGLPVAVLLIKGIHLFYFEPRPFVTFNFPPIVPESADASFPSRHATISATIALAYAYFKSKWAWLFLPIMIWVGISRIYTGVHYPLDIIGGFVVGIFALMISLQIKRILQIGFLRH